jgi:hypothetical protein
LFFGVNGVSAEEISNKIREYDDFAIINGNEAKQKWLPSALAMLRMSTNILYQAWSLSKETFQNEDFIVNTGYWQINRGEIGANLTILKDVINSDKIESLRSSVTGEIVQIHFSNFFKAETAPEDLKDFLALRKGGFETKKEKVAKLFINGKRVNEKYRDFNSGSAKSWNTKVYQNYFPNLTKSYDVKKLMRVLSHAGGSWLKLQK